MRRGAWRVALGLLLAALSFPDAAAAQPAGRWEAGGGVGFLTGGDRLDGVAAGVLVDGGWRPSTRLALVVEASRHRVTQDVGFFEAEVTFDAVLIGPRVRFRAAGVPVFAHLLAGAGRAAVSARTTMPVVAVGEDRATEGAIQIGGGLEAPLTRRLHLRAGLDYRRATGDTPLDQLRVSTGVVLLF